ncbi:MAG: MFS transporter [Acetobacteraceae bacterium]
MKSNQLRQRMRERGGQLRARLTAQNLHAPSLDWLNFLIADVRGALGPYVTVFLVAHQHWTPTSAGLVTTIGGLLGLLAQTPIGAWLDYTKHKRGAILLGLPIVSAAALIIVWFPSFWPVLIANGAMQVASGIFEPAVAALTVGLFARNLLTRRMGRNAAWARAGNIVVAITSGAVAYLISTQAVFLQVPVLAVLTGVVAMTIPYGKVDLRRARGSHDDKDADAAKPSGWFAVFRSRPLLCFMVASLLYELADAPLLTLVGQKLGIGDPDKSLLLTSGLIVASQAGMLIGAVAVGRWADRTGLTLPLLVSFAVLPVQAALTMMSDATAALLAIQVFGGLSTGIFSALTPLWLADATSGSGRYNLSQGVAATMRGIGVSMSGIAGGLLVDHFGYHAAFLACGVVGVAAGLLLWIGLRSDTAETKSARVTYQSP